MYGGIAKARSHRALGRGRDVKAQFQFTDVDLQACASELFGINSCPPRQSQRLASGLRHPARSGSPPRSTAPRR